MTPREIARNSTSAALAASPTEHELVQLETIWGVTEEQPKVFHDIFWALLNAKEFMFNH